MNKNQEKLIFRIMLLSSIISIPVAFTVTFKALLIIPIVWTIGSIIIYRFGLKDLRQNELEQKKFEDFHVSSVAYFTFSYMTYSVDDREEVMNALLEKAFAHIHNKHPKLGTKYIEDIFTSVGPKESNMVNFLMACNNEYSKLDNLSKSLVVQSCIEVCIKFDLTSSKSDKHLEIFLQSINVDPLEFLEMHEKLISNYASTKEKTA